MDSFELNKIAGAVLGTLLFVMGIGFLAEAVYAPIEGRGPGYALPEPEEGEHGVEVAEVEEIPLAVLLASADAEAGVKVAKKCASCHNFEEGAPNKTGPGLYGVVGRPIASHEGFAYSDVLSEMGATGEGWSYDKLNAFLESPKKYAPGTKMTFAGLRSEKDRANILAYLQSLSADPVPFPAVEEEPAAEEPAMTEEPTAEEPTAEEPMTEEAAPAEEEAMPSEPAAEESVLEEIAVEQPVDTDAAAEAEAADEAAIEEAETGQ